jgi:site-specific DNA-adenine methylase
LKFLPKPTEKVKTIIEPFAGSLAYSMFYGKPRVVGAEANPLMFNLWEWLRTAAEVTDLDKLQQIHGPEKVDIRNIDLLEPERTLLQLQVCGAYVGTLCTYVTYPKHSIGLKKLKEALPYIKRSLAPMVQDYRQVDVSEKDSIVFIDPPYLSSSWDYKKKKAGHDVLITPEEVEDFALSLTQPVVFSYGTGAAETFPRLEWRKLVDVKVPILRGGGTKTRTEYVAILNHDSSLLSD